MWIDLEKDWDGLELGFGSEQGLIGPGEIEDEPGLEKDWDGLELGFGSEQGLIGPGEIEDEPGVKLGDETGETGQERASATTFSLPGMCTMELVNSARYARCLCWRADQGGLVLNKAWVKGLWSVTIVNSLPSSMNLNLSHSCC